MTIRGLSARRVRQHWQLAVALGVLLVAGVALLPFFAHQINPDGVSYMSLAAKYASGNIGDAINAYWGPLLSWLVAPSFWLHVDAILYIKVLQIFVTLSIAVLTYYLLRRQGQTKIAASLGAFTAGLFGLYWGLAGPLTPDLLVCALLLGLVAYMGTLSPDSRLRAYAAVGVFGALLYYAKAVGLVLFGVVWLVWVVLDTRLAFRPLNVEFDAPLLKRKFLALLIMSVLMLPFVAAMSHKYHHFTLGSSGSYNFALVGPQTEGHPMMSRGLMAPPNPTAPSIWEDVSNIPLKNWSPLSSWHNFKHLGKVVLGNIAQTTQIFVPTMWPFLFVAAMYVVWPAPKRSASRQRGLWLLVAAALACVAAYLPIFTEPRYVYVAFIVMVIGFIAFFNDIFKTYGKKAMPVLVLAAGVLVGLWITTVLQVTQSFRVNEDIFAESQAIRAIVKPGSHVASDDFGSIYLCYYTKTTCYGVLNVKGDIKQQLGSNSIEYLVLAPESVEPINQATGQGLKQIEGLHYAGRNLYTTR